MASVPQYRSEDIHVEATTGISGEKMQSLAPPDSPGRENSALINSIDDAFKCLNILQNMRDQPRDKLDMNSINFLQAQPKIAKELGTTWRRGAIVVALTKALMGYIIQEDGKSQTEVSKKRLVDLCNLLGSHLTLQEKKILLHAVQSKTLVPTLINITATDLLKQEQGLKIWKGFGNITKYKSEGNQKVHNALVGKTKAFLKQEVSHGVDKDTAVKALVKVAGTGLFSHPDLKSTQEDLEKTYGNDVKLTIKHEVVAHQREIPSGGLYITGALTLGTFGMALPSLILWGTTAGVISPGLLTYQVRNMKKEFVEIMNNKPKNEPISLAELRVYGHLKAAKFIFEDVSGLDEGVKGRLEEELKSNENVKNEMLSISKLKGINRVICLVGTMILGGVLAAHA